MRPISFNGKLFTICTFDCSFQYNGKTVWQWMKVQGKDNVIDYELVKINDNNSHSFYTVSNMEDFSGTMNTK